MNEMTDEAKNEIQTVLSRTPEEFGVTLSGNNFNKNSINELQNHCL